MNDRVICNSCGGEYAPLGDDGIRYFHACPPLSLTELEAAIAAGLVTLSKAQLADALEGRLSVARPMARNENVLSTRARDAGSVKAEGAGITPVPVDVESTEVPK